MTAVKGSGGHLTELRVTPADRPPGDKWREEIHGLNIVMACQRNSHKKKWGAGGEWCGLMKTQRLTEHHLLIPVLCGVAASLSESGSAVTDSHCTGFCCCCFVCFFGLTDGSGTNTMARPGKKKKKP